MEFKKRQQPEREPERKMDYADYRAVEQKSDEFKPSSADMAERRDEFMAYCGGGVMRRHHGRNVLCILPGPFQLWRDRIAYFEGTGGRHEWYEYRKAEPVAAKVPVDNPFDFMSI
jgi:hypothetical protein